MGTRQTRGKDNNLNIFNKLIVGADDNAVITDRLFVLNTLAGYAKEANSAYQSACRTNIHAVARASMG